MLALLVHRGGGWPVHATPEAPSDAVTALLAESHALLQREDAKGALEALERARDLAPDNAAVYNTLCLAHGILRERAKAIAACERAIALDPHAPLPRNNLRWVQSLPEERSP